MGSPWRSGSGTAGRPRPVFPTCGDRRGAGVTPWRPLRKRKQRPSPDAHAERSRPALLPTRNTIEPRGSIVISRLGALQRKNERGERKKTIGKGNRKRTLCFSKARAKESNEKKETKTLRELFFGNVSRVSVSTRLSIEWVRCDG